jgi:hypothetical protein
VVINEDADDNHDSHSIINEVLNESSGVNGSSDTHIRKGYKTNQS